MALAVACEEGGMHARRNRGNSCQGYRVPTQGNGHWSTERVLAHAQAQPLASVAPRVAAACATHQREGRYQLATANACSIRAKMQQSGRNRQNSERHRTRV